MKFKFRELHSLYDAQQNFEQLEGRVILDATHGTATVTWAGGQQFTANITQAHGLGRVPVAVVLTTESATIACWAQILGASDAANIHFNAQAPALPAAGSTALVHWVAF